MTAIRLINIRNEREGNPARRLAHDANALLFMPGNGQVQAAQAFLFAHRWGGYHYDPLARTLGQGLADRGYGFLSMGLRRRGLEGQASSRPADDAADLQLAVDHLVALGFFTIFLVGEEAGAHSVVRYLVNRPDLQVAGIALIDPIDDFADVLRGAIGASAYQALLAEASNAVKLEAGDHVLIEVDAERPSGALKIFQHASVFTSWWGNSADTRISRLLESIAKPLFLLGHDATLLARISAYATANPAPKTKVITAGLDVAKSLAEWASELVPPVGEAPDTEIVTVTTEDGSELTGFLWTPADGRRTDTAVIYVHGLTAKPVRAFGVTQAPAYAEYGLALLNVGLRRSGLGGHMNSTPRMDAEDIEAFIKLLLARGYKRVVTTGHSQGSISVAVHQALYHNPAVVANVHIGPTADAEYWMSAGLGTERYVATVARAEEAIASGKAAETSIIEYVRRPRPDPYDALVRVFGKADSWLSWWGPGTLATISAHMPQVDVHLMLISGSDDTYNDDERFHALASGAINALSVKEIWYHGGNHSLEGFEQQAARDIAEWLDAQGAIEISKKQVVT